jgi:hypothetical protein
LKYVDPNGEILELTGSKDDREQSLNRIKKMVGGKEADNLHVVERDGHFFVEYSGSSNGMWKNEMGGIVADIIDNKEITTEYRVITGNNVTDKNGATYSFSEYGGAVTTPVSGNRIQIFVSYNAINLADGIGHKDENGNALKNTSETVDAHEFGHAWGIQKDNVYNRIMEVRKEYMEWTSSIGSSRGTKEDVIVKDNNRVSVMVENMARNRLKLANKQNHQP